MWKDVPTYKGYQASPDGRIRIKETEQVLKARLKHGTPYLQVFVNLEGRRVKRFVHQLIALTYCERCDGQTEVHHIDGNPTNNKASNLKWITKKEHLAIHANRVGDGWLRLLNEIFKAG